MQLQWYSEQLFRHKQQLQQPVSYNYALTVSIHVGVYSECPVLAPLVICVFMGWYHTPGILEVLYMHAC